MLDYKVDQFNPSSPIPPKNNHSSFYLKSDVLKRRTRIDRISDWPNGFWLTWMYLFKHTKRTPFVKPRGFGQSEIRSIRCLPFERREKILFFKKICDREPFKNRLIWSYCLHGLFGTEACALKRDIQIYFITMQLKHQAVNLNHLPRYVKT